jgi:hypothetical protein
LDGLIGEEPPDGINFNFSTLINSSKPFGPNKQVERELVVRVDYSERGDNYVQANYRKKLQTIYPDLAAGGIYNVTSILKKEK